MLPVALVIRIFVVDALERWSRTFMSAFVIIGYPQFASAELENYVSGRARNSYTHLKTRARSDDEVSDVVSQGDGFA